MSRVLAFASRYAVEALIVLAAFLAMLDVSLRRDAPEAPQTSYWIVVPAIALVVLPLLGRRRFPFAAPATVWLIAAASSFADGRLVVFAIGATVAGLTAAFLLGNLRDARQGRIGLVSVVAATTRIV